MKAKNIETGNLYKMFGEQTQDSGTAARCLVPKMVKNGYKSDFSY